jgi:hypothetical protein
VLSKVIILQLCYSVVNHPWHCGTSISPFSAVFVGKRTTEIQIIFILTAWKNSLAVTQIRI